MPSQRILRVESLLRTEISDIIRRKLKDPRIGMVTLTRVEVDPDLRAARIFVSIFGSRRKREEGIAGLRSASGFIRGELMDVLHLRPMPRLEFKLDESLERGSRTLDLLDQIAHEQQETCSRPEPGGEADPDCR